MIKIRAQIASISRSLAALALCGSSLLAVEKTDFVPGTNFVPPADDAGADGWSTEELSAAAGERLKGLTMYFVGSQKTPERKLAEIAASDLILEPLRPPNLETVFEDPAFLIRRAEDGKEARVLHRFESLRSRAIPTNRVCQKSDRGEHQGESFQKSTREKRSSKLPPTFKRGGSAKAAPFK